MKRDRALSDPYQQRKAGEFSGHFAVETCNRLIENVDARFPHFTADDRRDVILTTLLAIALCSAKFNGVEQMAEKIAAHASDFT